MSWYIIHTYTVTDPKTGKRWHKQNPWDIARLVMTHGDWKRYVSPRGDVTERIACSIINGTWDNQFPIEPDGEMVRSYVPPEPKNPISKANSIVEGFEALDRRLRNGGTYSTFQQLPPEMVMATMLLVLREHHKQQLLGANCSRGHADRNPERRPALRP